MTEKLIETFDKMIVELKKRNRNTNEHLEETGLTEKDRTLLKDTIKLHNYAIGFIKEFRDLEIKNNSEDL